MALPSLGPLPCPTLFEWVELWGIWCSLVIQQPKMDPWSYCLSSLSLCPYELFPQTWKAAYLLPWRNIPFCLLQPWILHLCMMVPTSYMGVDNTKLNPLDHSWFCRDLSYLAQVVSFWVWGPLLPLCCSFWRRCFVPFSSLLHFQCFNRSFSKEGDEYITHSYGI